MLTSGVPDIVLNAAEAMPEQPSRWQTAVEGLLDTENPVDRLRAARLLKDVRPDAARAVVTAGLGDPNLAIREEAARAIDTIGLPDNAPEWPKMLSDSSTWVRLEGARALFLGDDTPRALKCWTPGADRSKRRVLSATDILTGDESDMREKFTVKIALALALATSLIPVTVSAAVRGAKTAIPAPPAPTHGYATVTFPDVAYDPVNNVYLAVTGSGIRARWVAPSGALLGAATFTVASSTAFQGSPSATRAATPASAWSPGTKATTARR